MVDCKILAVAFDTASKAVMRPYSSGNIPSKQQFEDARVLALVMKTIADVYRSVDQVQPQTNGAYHAKI